MFTTDTQLGKTLEERRAALGLSINEVAAKTRIRREYLIALEGNDYTKLPGAAYITGFLRNYAEFLGLNANNVVNEYLSQRHNSSKDDEPQLPIQKKSSRRGIHLGVIALTAMLLAVYWMSTSQPNIPPQTLAPTAAVTALQPKEQVISVLPQVDKPPAIPPKPEPPAPLNITFNRRALLQLSANGPTQITLNIDGRPEQQYAVKQGSLLRWKISGKAEVNIADNSQVKLFLNKEQIILNDRRDLVLTRAAR